MEMSIFAELQQAIIDGKAPVAKELTDRGLKEGISPMNSSPTQSYRPWMRLGVA